MVMANLTYTVYDRMYGDFHAKNHHICRVSQNHVYTVLLTRKSTNIRAYAVYINNSGQPYVCAP